MLSQIDIGCYRGLKGVTLESLKRVNIFAGSNNSGKTSALEAIVMMGIYDDIDIIMSTLFSRYNNLSIDMVKSIFNNSQNEPVICLQAQFDNKEEIHTHITYSTQKIVTDDDNTRDFSDSLILNFSYDYNDANKQLKDNFAVKFEKIENKISIGITSTKIHDNIDLPCKFISFSRMENYSQLINSVEELLDNNMRNDLLEILRLFDASIENFEIIGNQRAIKLFKRDNDKPLYLNDYGNGMYKAFFIAASALLCESGILLVDEIETGVHYKALVGFVRYLMELSCKKNIQLFLTTHSLEAIDSILENKTIDLSDISLFHFKNSLGKISTRRYSGDRMHELRNQIGFDMR